MLLQLSKFGLVAAQNYGFCSLEAESYSRNVERKFLARLRNTVLSKCITLNSLDRWEIAQDVHYLKWNTIIGWQLFLPS